ncbi:hypothetical protein AVEN_144736-1 [Araneus ventricosus]|uniref:Tesmin/TSO1-like CXC domain-containing protein n=1 Tax=Araneus ventricosus TaxID=182803 RepID=A0A4Y2W069_ARAVE|nr:hypothetical protein AVEN_272079-1 [Araneus ventricosus]GBO31144.1 hypothetical protein AVEN_229651-1 [Araneus ventricosus]GBO31148.1 hypothetical protein AVEN_105628-1 [Araneus ventricosus]GBO31151.1 hypothetical protein AVEN_144736-1 [Araneus ventricosus]
MLPHFHASGHFPRAKSAHLYLQDMLQLENLIDPSVFRRFIQGFFTVRRSAKFSCRTSTDMTIEQSLMKSMQTDGGISRGRSNKLDPENWGWVSKDNGLEPIQTLLPPASEKLLNTIFCNCKKGRNCNCACKKVGLFSSQVCSNCQGESCSNVKSNTTDEDAYDIDEGISDPFFFLEQSIEMQQQGEEVSEEEHIIEEFEDYFDGS